MKKHPPGREVNREDSFSFNNSFTSSLQKIKISTVAARIESGEERRETQDRVEEERRFQTDVRVLISILLAGTGIFDSVAYKKKRHASCGS